MMAPPASRAVRNCANAWPASLARKRSTNGCQSAATGQCAGAHSVKRGTSLVNMSGWRKQLRQSRAWIGRAHEGLTHQKRVDTGRPQAQHIVTGLDATLADQQAVSRQFAHER